mgnify:CR=1 FL=1
MLLIWPHCYGNISRGKGVRLKMNVQLELDRSFMREAIAEARKAACAGEAPVGARSLEQNNKSYTLSNTTPSPPPINT